MNFTAWVYLFLAYFVIHVSTETGADMWLRYAKIDQPDLVQVPNTIKILNSTDQIIENAATEITKGFEGMLGVYMERTSQEAQEACLILATTEALLSSDNSNILPNSPDLASQLETDGYFVEKSKDGSITIAGNNSNGVLYGAFDVLRQIAVNQSIESKLENPSSPIRFANQWDNLDNYTSHHGSIERGYGGPSIYFNTDGSGLPQDLSKVHQFGRFLASIGLNGLVINNVNVNDTLYDTMLPDVKTIADILRPWGVRVSMSLSFESPQSIGNLDTFDPLDSNVIDWWDKKISEIYKYVPDFVGALVKADSEGQPGPNQYNRTLAEAANMFGKAFEKYDGIVMYRAFVYDHNQDYNDTKADRARAAYDYFNPFNGQFMDNVVIQIKNGPIDFQNLEPASPLFGGLDKTNIMIELQITQEYFGQGNHLVYLGQYWKDVLDFDFEIGDQPSTVTSLVTGKRFNRRLGGFAGVTNVGTDLNWFGYDLSQANMYAFGRLAWNPYGSSDEYLDEWTKMTFGLDKDVVETINDMNRRSWQIYYDYTGPLGAGTFTNILTTHYGPNASSQEWNGWGQYFRAYRHSIGMDRSVKSGTGYSGQYPPAVAKRWENVETTPEELLLFFHHVNYTHILQSGKTLIQYVYDSRYEAAEKAQKFVQQWGKLKGKIDSERFEAILNKLIYQAGHSIVWRDSITEYFYSVCGIKDEKGRVPGNYPERVEAESMDLKNYKIITISPLEDASNGTAITTGNQTGTATTKLNPPKGNGQYDLVVQYFDIEEGSSTISVSINDQPVGQIVANMSLPMPTNLITGCTSTRKTFKNVTLQSGDVLEIKGVPDKYEGAIVDYIAMLPPNHLNEPE